MLVRPANASPNLFADVSPADVIPPSRCEGDNQSMTAEDCGAFKSCLFYYILTNAMV